MSALSDWLKVIQLKARFLFGLWVFGALVLLLPTSLADTVGITNLRQSYRGWFGLGCLAAFAFWLVQLYPAVANWRKTRKQRAVILKSLQSLSPDEWLLLAYCYDRQQRSICMEFSHKAVVKLVQKGLLIPGTGTYNILHWPHAIPQFVWEDFQSTGERLFPDSERAKCVEGFSRLDNWANA